MLPTRFQEEKVWPYFGNIKPGLMPAQLARAPRSFVYFIHYIYITHIFLVLPNLPSEESKPTTLLKRQDLGIVLLETRFVCDYRKVEVWWRWRTRCLMLWEALHRSATNCFLFLDFQFTESFLNQTLTYKSFSQICAGHLKANYRSLVLFFIISKILRTFSANFSWKLGASRTVLVGNRLEPFKLQ